MKKVCAVIVTYNRKDYLINLLDGLLKQSYKLSSIFIIDNNSSDGTDKKLKEIGFCDHEINIDKINEFQWNGIKSLYLRKSQNLGGAGGFYNALKYSNNFDIDYIWIMDDDVYPIENCLEKLINKMNQNVKVCVPNRSDENFKDKAIIEFNLNNPFKYFTRRKKVIKDFTNLETINITDMPFEGPLIDKNIINEIGLPKKEFFIFGDDTEYALRIKKVTNISFVVDAKLKKMIIPKKEFTMNWRSYYSYRNIIAIDRIHGENIMVKYLSPVLLWIDYSARAILQLKFKNAKILFKAFIDGYTLKLGKRVEPGEF